MNDGVTYADLLTAFYAAATAIEEGKIAEVEIEQRLIRDDVELTITMIVRRDVKHFQVSGPDTL